MSCKFAKYTDGCYLCEKNDEMDECMFDHPDSKRCSEMYGIFSKETSKDENLEDEIKEEIFDDNDEITE